MKSSARSIRTGTFKVNNSAVTARLVTEAYAKRHSKTTFKETIKAGKHT